jgi:hypothetical protein
MGKQGVGLEHHIDRPLIGRHARQIHAVEHNLPGGRLFKARQHAQQGRFPQPDAPSRAKFRLYK